MKKTIMAMLLATTLLFTACSDSAKTGVSGFEDGGTEETEEAVAIEETTEETTEDAEPSEPKNYDVENIQIGDIITFGKYEQDINMDNGKEAIEWIVLDKNGSSLLVISKYALDCKQYNTWDTEVDWNTQSSAWETCYLRKWLNSDFISNAFNKREQMKIDNTVVKAAVYTNAENDPDFDPSSDKDTVDKVFLLSETEVKEYFGSESERICEPTNYALSQNAYAKGSVRCWWSLRTSVGYGSYVNYVDDEGDISIQAVDKDYFGIRPAMWITL